MEKLYCIVETLEDGKRCFSATPKNWISGNRLLWPPKSQLYNARKNSSNPKSNWKNFEIINLVRDNIENLEDAILAEQKSTESSSEEAMKKKQKKFQREHPGLASRSDYDFNLNAEFREVKKQTQTLKQVSQDLTSVENAEGTKQAIAAKQDSQADALENGKNSNSFSIEVASDVEDSSSNSEEPEKSIESINRSPAARSSLEDSGHANQAYDVEWKQTSNIQSSESSDVEWKQTSNIQSSESSDEDFNISQQCREALANLEEHIDSHSPTPGNSPGNCSTPKSLPASRHPLKHSSANYTQQYSRRENDSSTKKSSDKTTLKKVSAKPLKHSSENYTQSSLNGNKNDSSDKTTLKKVSAKPLKHSSENYTQSSLNGNKNDSSAKKPIIKKSSGKINTVNEVPVREEHCFDLPPNPLSVPASSFKGFEMHSHPDNRSQLQLHDILNQIMSVQEYLKSSVAVWMARVDTRLQRLEEHLCPQITLETDDPFAVSIRSVEDVQCFNDSLNEKNYKKKVIKSMALLGGSSASNHMKKIFQYLFPNDILRQYSWRGTLEKKPFNTLTNVRGMVLAAVVTKYPQVTIAEYDAFCKDFIRYAKWRKGGKKGLVEPDSN